jgi:hypothetical protein
MKPSRILLATLALASGAALAGQADVKFIDPDRFADAGTSYSDRQDVLNTLANHLQRLAAGLPAGQVLRVDVLDVDLAGYTRYGRRGNVRVIDGRADAPEIRLRYSLESNGQVIRSGDERVFDLDYMHATASWRATGPLYYEKRLLSQWFARNFGEAHAAR